MKTLTYKTSATKEVTFTRTGVYVDSYSRPEIIDIAINGNKVGYTYKSNLKGEVLTITMNDNQIQLPMKDVDGNSTAQKFNDFAHNRVLHTFADMTERSEFIGDRDNFGTFWMNDNNEVCTYEYL